VLVWLTGGFYAVIWQFQMMRDINRLSGIDVFPPWIRALLLCGWFLHVAVLMSVMTLGFLHVPPYLVGYLILSSIGLMVSLFAVPVAATLRLGRMVGSEGRIRDAVGAGLLFFVWFASFPYAQARLNRVVERGDLQGS
jgi:hypothetical protein